MQTKINKINDKISGNKSYIAYSGVIWKENAFEEEEKKQRYKIVITTFRRNLRKINVPRENIHYIIILIIT